DEPPVVAFEQEGEVRAAALADPLRADRTGAETALVEERPDPVEHKERRPLEALGLGRRLDDVGSLSCPRNDFLDHLGLRVGVVLDVLPRPLRELVLGARVALAVGVASSPTV